MGNFLLPWEVFDASWAHTVPSIRETKFQKWRIILDLMTKWTLKHVNNMLLKLPSDPAIKRLSDHKTCKWRNRVIQVKRSYSVEHKGKSFIFILLFSFTLFLVMVTQKISIFFCYVSLCGNIYFYVRIEVFTAMMIQVVVFWVVTPCSIVIGYQSFRGLCCLHGPPERWYHYTASQPTSSRLALTFTALQLGNNEIPGNKTAHDQEATDFLTEWKETNNGAIHLLERTHWTFIFENSGQLFERRT